ncbi:MAG TPA: signal peptidase I [Candidatus Angelobacter sp.]|nr:signal peptidase I [Candidatus Angelobacter sp.]
MRLFRRLALGVVVLVLGAAATVAAAGWHEGYRLYVVHTGSMSPALRPGDAVLAAPAPGSVRPGDVVTFTVLSGPDSVVTHRVVAVADGLVTTKGDANRTADPWTLHMSQVVGTAAAFLPHAGYLLVYLRQPQGLASVVVAALALVLLWQLFFPAAPARSAGTHSAG